MYFIYISEQQCKEKAEREREKKDLWRKCAMYCTRVQNLYRHVYVFHLYSMIISFEKVVTCYNHYTDAHPVLGIHAHTVVEITHYRLVLQIYTHTHTHPHMQVHTYTMHTNCHQNIVSHCFQRCVGHVTWIQFRYVWNVGAPCVL